MKKGEGEGGGESEDEERGKSRGRAGRYTIVMNMFFSFHSLVPLPPNPSHSSLTYTHSPLLCVLSSFLFFLLFPHSLLLSPFLIFSLPLSSTTPSTQCSCIFLSSIILPPSLSLSLSVPPFLPSSLPHSSPMHSLTPHLCTPHSSASLFLSSLMLPSMEQLTPNTFTLHPARDPL